MSNRYKFGLLGLVVAVILALISITSMVSAQAHRPAHAAAPCTKVVTVIDKEAFTETIVHPEVTEVIHHEAVIETTPAVWANWSPNHTQGPQDYTPIWPEDERGTWHVHTQGIPGGHEGPDGVYQMGEGNSPWFYRQAESVIVVSPAFDETVVVEEERVVHVDHPEVSHEETVEVDCPKTPEEPKEPKEPKAPNPDIQQPGPDEEIVFQSFNDDGDLVEQRVSAPIPAADKQEGM